MYRSHRLTNRQRLNDLEYRRLHKLPWHSPPHFGVQATLYLITGAGWRHQSVLSTPQRRDEWAEILNNMETEIPSDIRAWVVLPNHYHLLTVVAIPDLKPWLARMHNGASTRWNREDLQTGRRVWYRFSDRAIRSERHYYASLNYIHANPVKHGHVKNAADWPWSSFHRYKEEVGVEQLRTWWKAYPPDKMGASWDEF